MDDILDTIQGDNNDYNPKKNSRPGSNSYQKSNNRFFDAIRQSQDLKQQNSFEGLNSPTNVQSSLMMTGKLLSVITPSNKSQAENIIDPLSLPLRIRGMFLFIIVLLSYIKDQRRMERRNLKREKHLL